MFLKTDGAGNLSFSSDLPTTSFTGATVETSIADSDLVLIYDDSATAVRKMTKANLVAGIGASAGQVIQVVSTHKTDDFTTASASFTDVTGLSVSITPSSASNKIYVTFTITVGNTSSSYGTHIRLMRDSTEIAPARSVANYESSWHGFSGDSNITKQISFQFLDSPSTTSATTYKLQIKPQTGTSTVNRSGSDAGSQAYSHKSSSSITVMEVKG